MKSFNFTTSDDTFYDVTTPNGSTKCIESNNLFTIAFIPFKAIVTILNLILFTAAARDRKKLQRQNYTFDCVMSTLLSNTVYLLMSIWLTVDNYPQTSRDPQQGIMTFEKRIWIFSEALTLSMVLGICANVTSLIYVTLDNVFYVGRAVNVWGTKGRKQEKSRPVKIRIAQILIVASWVLPFLITGLTFAWNCAARCRCPSNNFQGEHCPRNENCSSMWAPMKIEFLFVVTGIWALEVIGLLVFVINGIREHNQSLGTASQAENPDQNKVEEGDCDVAPDVRAIASQNEKQTKTEEKRRKSAFKRKFNSSLKLATSLTSVVTLCTTPAAVATILDICLTKSPYSHLILASGLFMFIYCAICPILMWKFLPSLRSSTFKFLMTIKNCSSLSRDSKKTKTMRNLSPANE